MTSVVIWRYRENKMNLSFKGGGGGHPPKIMAGETLHSHECDHVKFLLAHSQKMVAV